MWEYRCWESRLRFPETGARLPEWAPLLFRTFGKHEMPASLAPS